MDIFKAIRDNNVKRVKELIEDGVDINVRSNEETTALLEAVANGYYEITKLLLAAGADINAKDNNGMNSMDWAKRNVKDKQCIIDLLNEYQE